MTLNTETEEKIIASAEKLFYRKGKAGTSMQDIADDAGINRTLLNYYFRSKDQLFEAVFRKALGGMVVAFRQLMHSERPFVEHFPVMIKSIIDELIDNPQIPIFVLQELSSNPERVPVLIKEMGIDPEAAMEKMASEGSGFSPGGMDPRQMILNILSLCIFPFAARPVVTALLFSGDQEAYLAAMRQRKELVAEIVQQFISQQSKQ
jgi:AcrR family transcriptional regulator